MVARCGLTLHTGIEGLWVRPTVFPPSAAISPDVYGDRTGPWGDGAGWLEYWAELGTGWVNLGLAVGTDGLPHIAYESQWRKGDQFERLPDDDYPAFNFNG